MLVEGIRGAVDMKGSWRLWQSLFQPALPGHGPGFLKTFVKSESMGRVSFVTQMAEQMRCGNSKLAYHFKMHKPGSAGEARTGRRGPEQKQAGGSAVLPGEALSGLRCPWYMRAHAHSHAAPRSLACKPAAPELFWECQLWVGLKEPSAAPAPRTWSALCGGRLLGGL